MGNKKTKLSMLALFVILGLLAVWIFPALAVTVGNDQVNFLGVSYDDPNAGESTWFYQVISGSAPAISHVTFELNLACLDVTDAGTWDGVNFANRTSGGGSPVVGTDPTTGITGIKFDEAFNDGETRYYYFTVDGNYAIDDMVTVASKGGPGFDTALIDGPSGSCAPYEPPADPSLDLEKLTNGIDADTPGGVMPILVAGAAVQWDYVVLNNGNVTLTDIAVSDDILGLICTIDSLEPGATATCTANGTATVGLYGNIGTASTVFNGGPVSDSDPSHYLGVNPMIDIEKSTNGHDADEAPGPEIEVGSPVTWEYIVTNTGDVALTDVSVSDDQLGLICTIATLAPGASATCTASGVAGIGQYENLGGVSASYGDYPVDDEDYSHYFGFEPTPDLPALDLEKSTNGQDADEPTGPQLMSGALVEWTYTVYNSGNVTLTDIAVNDDQLGLICTLTSLTPGDSATCTASGTAGVGQYANLGTATTTYNGAMVSDSDPSHYYGILAALDLEKYTNGVDADAPPGPQILVGEPVVWTYVVTNIGNVPLTNVIVGDDILGIICTIPALAPGESQTCTKTGTAVEGQYTNLGKAATRYPDQRGMIVSDQDRSHYLGIKPFVPNPSLDIEKHTNGADSDLAPGLTIPVGSPVLWEYIVTNTGNVDLTNIQVGDNILGMICTIESLSPGQSYVCTASGVAVAGEYMNIGKAVTWWGGGPKTGGIKITDMDRSHYTGTP